MSLSIFQDEELAESLGYSTGATWSPYELRVSDGLRTASPYTGPEQKRAWRAIPANREWERAYDRARFGSVPLEQHLARVRAERLAREADADLQAARKARQVALKRERDRTPAVREKRREYTRQRRAAMGPEAVRAEWLRHQHAKRERDRARRAS